MIHDASEAAKALRIVLADPAKAGQSTSMHLLLGRPRRGEWRVAWANLPGFSKIGNAYRHILLPGWEYTYSELETEMIPDLEHLAATGQQPKVATR